MTVYEYSVYRVVRGLLAPREVPGLIALAKRAEDGRPGAVEELNRLMYQVLTRAEEETPREERRAKAG